MSLRSSLLAVIMALAPAVAFAQPVSSDAPARVAFERGIADVDAGRITNAVAAFEESYRLRPSAVVLYNLAAAYARLGRHQEAIATYGRYLTEGGSRIPPDRVQTVHQRIDELQHEMPVVVLHIRPAPFTLTVDGRPQTVTGEEVALDPGVHLLVVSAATRATQQREVHLSPGTRVTWEAELASVSPPPASAAPVVVASPVRVVLTPHPAPVPAVPATAPSSPTITSRWGFWTGVGVLAVGGTVLALGLTGTFDHPQVPVGGTAFDVSAIRF